MTSSLSSLRSFSRLAMSHTVATFDRINALVDRTSSEIRNVLVQVPGNIISSKSSTAVCPPPPAPKALPKAASCLSDEVRVSPLHTARAPASASGSQMSSIIQKYKGKVGGSRLYRSLDKKHLLVVQTVDLEEPMADGEARNMERALKTHSEVSLKDYAPPSTSGRQIAYL